MMHSEMMTQGASASCAACSAIMAIKSGLMLQAQSGMGKVLDTSAFILDGRQHKLNCPGNEADQTHAAPVSTSLFHLHAGLSFD